MSTALEKIETALKADAVVIAGRFSTPDELRSYEPRTMTEADLASIADRGTVIAAAIKKLDGERREILKPFEEGIAKINARFGEVLYPLRRAKDRYGELYTHGKNELKRRAEVLAAEQRVLAAEVATPEEDGPSPPPASVRVDAPKNTTAGGIGRATGTRRLCVKMVDLALVAEHFPGVLELNEKKALEVVRGAMAAGKPTPGLEHWFDEKTSFGGRR